jgi:putative addiction module killer protein
MLDVRETDEFSEWLGALRDRRAKAKVLVRVERLARGNPGDVPPVGEGVSAGYRVYYVPRGTRYILLLAGGDKSRQDADIAESKTSGQRVSGVTTTWH